MRDSVYIYGFVPSCFFFSVSPHIWKVTAVVKILYWSLGLHFVFHYSLAFPPLINLPHLLQANSTFDTDTNLPFHLLFLLPIVTVCSLGKNILLVFLQGLRQQNFELKQVL